MNRFLLIKGVHGEKHSTVWWRSRSTSRKSAMCRTPLRAMSDASSEIALFDIFGTAIKGILACCMRCSYDIEVGAVLFMIQRSFHRNWAAVEAVNVFELLKLFKRSAASDYV